MTVTFHVPGIPVPQGSLRAFMPRVGKHPIVTADNAKLRPWRSLVTCCAKQAWSGPPTWGAVDITLTFCFSKPKSYPKNRELPHTKRPDVDKLARGMLDALTGVVFHDDSQVVCLEAVKRYADVPGCHVAIEASE